MIDERITALKYFLPLDENSDVLIIGDAPWGMVTGLSRSVKQVIIACFTEEYKEEIADFIAKKQVSNVQVLKWQEINLLPFHENSLQAIAIVNKKFPTATILKECNRILTPGGTVLVQTSKPKARSLWLKAFEPNKSDNPRNPRNPIIQQTEVYAIVPGFAKPRWIIPLKSRQVSSSSLKLYNPAKLYAKVRKRILSALSRIGLGGLLMKNRFVIIKKLADHDSHNANGLHDFLVEVLGRKDIEIALSTGTPGYYRKVTAQIMASDGEILAYAKIADTDQTKKLLYQEASILRRLEGLNIVSGDIPRVLHFSPWGKETILVQSNVRKPYSRRHKNLNERLISFLSEVFNKSAVPKTLRECASLVQLEDNIKRLKGRISEDWEYRLANSLEIIHKNLSHQKIPMGICHGDFTPFNIYIGRGTLSAFDWEYAKEESIPFWDLFHFIIQANALRNRFKPSSLLEAIAELTKKTQSTHPLFTLISKYANSLNFDFSSNLNIFLLFYLADVSSFYLDMFTNYGSISNKNRALLDVWAGMMDEMAGVL